jgi:hypothetical protein
MGGWFRPPTIFYNPKKYNMKNYFDYWYKRTIKDGLKAIRLVIGLGLAVSFGYSVNLPIGIMVFSYVLVDTLIDKN